MRKADYNTLAQLIHTHREGARRNIIVFEKDHATREFWRGRSEVLTVIAYDFANAASVDRIAFLKACGID